MSSNGLRGDFPFGLGGLFALGLCLAALGLFTSSAGAASLNPTSTGFGEQQVGSESAPEVFSLTVYCGVLDPMTATCIGASSSEYIPHDTIAINPPGDFTFTDTCPSTLAPFISSTESCSISVTFAPTSPGPKQATLSAGDAGVGPTATLEGTGLAVPALELEAEGQRLKRKIEFFATASVDVTMIATGKAIKPKAAPLVADERTRISATLKRAARKDLAKKIDRKGTAKVRVEATATVSSGPTLTDAVKVQLSD